MAVFLIFLLNTASIKCVNLKQSTYYQREHPLVVTLLTISSIFKIDRTVSVANVIELTETRRGWTTCSSNILEMVPLRTLIPAEVSPFACRFRNSVTVYNIKIILQIYQNSVLFYYETASA